MEDTQENKRGDKILSSEEKIFTQEELNLIIKKRLDRAKIQWKKEYLQTLCQEKNKLIFEQLTTEATKQTIELNVLMELLNFLVTKYTNK